jgi:hypothetical protein
MLLCDVCMPFSCSSATLAYLSAAPPRRLHTYLLLLCNAGIGESCSYAMLVYLSATPLQRWHRRKLLLCDAGIPICYSSATLSYLIPAPLRGLCIWLLLICQHTPRPTSVQYNNLPCRTQHTSSSCTGRPLLIALRAISQFHNLPDTHLRLPLLSLNSSPIKNSHPPPLTT